MKLKGSRRATVHFWVLQGVPHKGDIQLHDVGGIPVLPNLKERGGAVQQEK
jgi:hypothetical protein